MHEGNGLRLLLHDYALMLIGMPVYTLSLPAVTDASAPSVFWKPGATEQHGRGRPA